MKHLIAIFILLTTVTWAERVALVIGNNKYTNLPESRQLTSPEADADDVAKELRKLGYRIVGGAPVKSATREAMTTAIEQFATAAKGAEAAVFYFSGHSIQIGEDNFLLPSDLPKLTAYSVLKGRSVLLRDAVMVALEEAGVQTKVIILDCCRDNPFAAQIETALAQVGKTMKTKSAGEITGFGPGFYLAFATSPGQTALDGNGRRNSPFTAAMLQTLKAAPDSASKDVDMFFRDVKSNLLEDQVSWTNHSLKASFSLAPGGMKFEPVIPKKDGDPFAGTQPGQTYENGQATAFRWCPPGDFWMGSSAEDMRTFARDGVTTDDETRHRVKLSKGFWMAQHEVTQGEWESVMGRDLKDQAKLMLQDDTKYNIGGKQTTLRDLKGVKRDADPATQIGVQSPSFPIYFVNWEEAADYCARLTLSERRSGKLPAGWKYALPTEAQWEYACRAGSESTIYSGALLIKGANNGPALDAIAWYGGNSSQNYTGQGWNTETWKEKQYPGGTAGPRKVGEKKENAWGLKDMLGNVWEWTGDWYAKDITGTSSDPKGPNTGADRVYRGGSWDFVAAYCRAAFRNDFAPGYRSSGLGFRPALVPSN